jgi:hypothetical protein
MTLGISHNAIPTDISGVLIQRGVIKPTIPDHEWKNHTLDLKEDLKGGTALYYYPLTLESR